MRDQRVTTVIDGERCTGCGRCVAACPADTLAMRNGKAVVAGERSLGCGHCAAICPVGAVTVGALDPAQAAFASFAADPRQLPEGAFDPARLVRLMASRRSCRAFQARPVPRDLLEDLVRIGITAPSGTNSQCWTFTLLPTRAAVLVLGEAVAGFFRRLNRRAESVLLRRTLKLLGRGELDAYHRGYRVRVEEALRDWEQGGRDRLFHGAPAAIVVGSARGGTTPVEDALLAAQNILLAAHSLGLGSCLIGFAVAALARDRAARTALGIPAEERVHAVIALGYPEEVYLRPAGRARPVVRCFDPVAGGPRRGLSEVGS